MSRFLLLALIVACSSNGGPPPEDGGADTSEPDASLDADTDAAEDDAGGDDAGPDDDAGADDAGNDDAGADDAGGDSGDACMPADCPPPPDGCMYVGGDPCGECGELVCDGTECTDDSDCFGGFCRATMDPEVRACHPWAGEGESCGGFTAPWAVERCNPDVHTCMGRSPLIADAPGTCLLEVTVAELAANPGLYTDRVVGVRTSYVTNGLSACTRRACPLEMPCCNDCNSGMFAFDMEDGDDSVQLFDDAGTAYECSGTECDMRETCTVMPDLSYRIIGTFNGTGLLVDSIQRVSFD